MSKSHRDKISIELVKHDGIGYIEYIKHIAKQSNCRGYLEIGTNSGASLAAVDCDSIAVDPDFQITLDVIGKKQKCLMYQMTSDEFFDRHDPRILLGHEIDVVFLDGMHLYEFLLRDIMNSERFCSKDSVIILHDCIPPTFEMTNRAMIDAVLNEKYKNYWTGDVWKVIPAIQKYRPDLKLVFVDCPPSGLVMITNCDSNSTTLRENFSTIVEEYSESDGDYDLLKAYLASITIISSAAAIATARDKGG